VLDFLGRGKDSNKLWFMSTQWLRHMSSTDIGLYIQNEIVLHEMEKKIAHNVYGFPLVFKTVIVDSDDDDGVPFSRLRSTPFYHVKVCRFVFKNSYLEDFDNVQTIMRCVHVTEQIVFHRDFRFDEVDDDDDVEDLRSTQEEVIQFLNDFSAFMKSSSFSATNKSSNVSICLRLRLLDYEDDDVECSLKEIHLRDAVSIALACPTISCKINHVWLSVVKNVWDDDFQMLTVSKRLRIENIEANDDRFLQTNAHLGTNLFLSSDVTFQDAIKTFHVNTRRLVAADSISLSSSAFVVNSQERVLNIDLGNMVFNTTYIGLGTMHRSGVYIYDPCVDAEIIIQNPGNNTTIAVTNGTRYHIRFIGVNGRSVALINQPSKMQTRFVPPENVLLTFSTL
jgi:hypothetical protein